MVLVGMCRLTTPLAFNILIHPRPHTYHTKTYVLELRLFHTLLHRFLIWFMLVHCDNLSLRKRPPPPGFWRRRALLALVEKMPNADPVEF
jgi:hypothetical protein